VRTCAVAAVTLALCSAAFAEPVVFWASDPVQPNETVMVCGDGFTDAPVVRLAALPDGDAGNPGAALSWPGGSAQVEALQADNRSLKFVVPAEMAPGAYAFRVETADGASEPVRLNCPTPYWSQGDAGETASPRGWVRVFGRCVGSEASATVLLQPEAGGADVRIAASEADTWSVRALVPDDVAPGAYRVFVHNGHGGPAGWAEARAIEVAAAGAWPTEVFDVTQFGAAGRGEVADAIAMGQALAAAEQNGGGVVYLPRGRYRMQGTLTVPRRTVLRGEATGLVSLFWPDTEDPYTLIEGTNSFAIEDLTIYGTNYRHVIAAEVGTPDSGDTALRRVRVRADMYRGHLSFEEVDARFRTHKQLSSGGGDTVRMGGRNVVIEDCDLYGSGRSLYLLRPRSARVTGNTLYNGRWGWYCIDGSDGLILEGNRIIGADLMSTGGSLNCYSSAASQNVFYARNRLERLHGWDREAMTSDAGYGAWFGTPEQVGADSLVLGGDEPDWRRRADWSGAGVFVLSGKGMGQYRLIASYDGRNVTLDRPWDVEPDTASQITITMMQRRYLFVGNEFEDVGIALQYYGTSIEHVAAENSVTRGGGFYNSGRWYRHFQPSWYCQFLGNTITEGNCYRYGPNGATTSGTSFIASEGLQAQGGTAPLALCSAHRRNRLLNNAEMRFIGVSAEHPGLRDVVAEHNTIENTDRGVFVDDGCTGVLLRENSFTNVGEEIVDAQQLREQREAARAALIDQQEPIAHWTFDDPIGGNAQDASGHGFIAMPTGSIDYEQSLSGLAPRFEGSSYFVVAGGEALEFPRITLSAWVLPDSVTGRWGVVAKRSRGTTCPYVLAIREGGITFEATDAAGQWSYNFTTKPLLQDGQWHQITATCEDGVGVRIFCDGALVAEKAVTEPLISTGNDLTIGYENWGGPEAQAGDSGNFRGLIDEVSMWSRVLGEDEIVAEYARLKDAAAADIERRAREAAEREALRERFATEVVLTGGVDWTPVIVDGFERAAIGPEWLELRGKWSIADGTLRSSETGYLAWHEPVAAPVRIEYDARSAHPGDLTAFWGTKDAAWTAGYFIGFASNGNTASKLMRLGQQVMVVDGPVAEPGRWYHVIAQVLPDRVQLYVDGDLALEYEERHPLDGKRLPGIITWSDGEFDNVRIYSG